ncbi:MAG: hypothetical protein ABI947_29115 [Chloroflexota bacterium]
MQRRGKRSKQVVSEAGEVRVERQYYYCESCGHGVSPLDEQLGLSGSVTNDGMARHMVWLSGLLTYQHCADALFPNQPDALTRWRQQRTDDLFLGNIHCITQPLDQAGCSEHSHYFHNHQRRMHYLKFRENGCPIGSGTVESSVKQFKTRLTGTGMRWNRSAAQQMLVIRAAVLDHSVDHRWANAAYLPH